MTSLTNVTPGQVTSLDELVDLVVGMERSIASLQAARDGALALANRWAMHVAEGDVDASDLSLRSVAAELGAALRVTDRTVQRRMLLAETLVERFPSVWQAQGAGVISAGHARVIADAGEHITDDASREEYCARVLEFAVGESANRVRGFAERVAQEYASRSMEERHRDAREQRAIWVKDATDGMAELGAYGPAALIHAMFDRVTRMAKRFEPEQPVDEAERTGAVSDASRTDASDAGASGDAAESDCGKEDALHAANSHREGRRRWRFETEPDRDPVPVDESPPGRGSPPSRVHGPEPDGRTLDQRRFDIAMDLLLTGAPAGHDTPDGALAAIRGEVTITVPALSLTGIDGAEKHPPELNGRCPIDPATARQLVGAASGWDRVLTHPVTGAILAVDRYRPSQDLRRTLRARDQRCRFPGCGMPATASDLDHTHDAALGGDTAAENLGTLCRRHHVLKHQSAWKVKQIGGGLLEWTSPTGRSYIDRPPPQHTVTFAETPAQPAITAPF